MNALTMSYLCFEHNLKKIKTAIQHENGKKNGKCKAECITENLNKKNIEEALSKKTNSNMHLVFT